MDFPRAQVRKVLERARASRLSAEEKARMVREFKSKVETNPRFYYQLEPVSDKRSATLPRLFLHHRKSAVVKMERGTRRINPLPLHGIVSEDYEDFFNAFREEQKNNAFEGRSYILVRPKVLSRFSIPRKTGDEDYFIEHYLMMEHFNTVEPTGAEKEHYSEALRQLEADAMRIREKHALPAPHFGHYLCLGNTNPEEPTKGKWVVAFPRDFI